MSTRYQNKNGKGLFVNPDSSAYNIPEDFNLENCTIEDVDRALFTLFDKDLPFTYVHKGETRRSPVIFASGERFAVLRRKKPLRDKAGSLVLPLVSIMRTGIHQAPMMGSATSQNIDIVVSRKLSDKDSDYQKILNKMNLQNSDDAARSIALRRSAAGQDNADKGVVNKQAAVSHQQPTTLRQVENIPISLDPSIKDNIYEVITMPPPKYYVANYEITFWTQYTVQMNNMLMSMMSLYQNYAQRTFKLETPKGYWFVAYVEEDFSPGNNFDDFADSERLVRYSFNLKVPAYVIGDVSPSGPSGFRKFVSAPQFSFGIETSIPINVNVPVGQVDSSRAKDYLLNEFLTELDSLPKQSIGTSGAPTSIKGPIINELTGSTSIGGKEV